ncbi:alpha/beta hydrolase [Xanthobacter autotrophicus DSM 431]|uniref:alpha/beta hydrolase n=1 Tax=Xanthobacter nonsaccharivorans TaxID=3119912 RepID=UPI00372B8BD9
MSAPASVAGAAALAFTHRFVPATDPAAPPLLLLHGTGGDENDLLPIGRMLAPGAALLSPRGKVSEGGMPRFFRRLAEGVFDEQDVVRRANELADFIAEARAAYGLPAPVAVGFSNGANIAAALLMLRPEALSGAILLRAMVPLAAPPAGTLPGTPVLILSGAADPIVPRGNAERLADELTRRGGQVEHKVLSGGHGLTPADVAAARAWFQANTPRPAA